MRPSVSRVLALCLSAFTAVACQSGGQKSARIVYGGPDAPQEDLVESVRAAEEEAREARADFETALTLYRRVTTPQASELDELSEDFEEAVEDCRERFEELAARRARVDEEQEQLFRGWNDELGRFSLEVLRAKSAAMLQETQRSTRAVTQALERLQARMEPVMKKLEDYALFFHHNLSPRAIATLEDTYKDFDAEFRALQGEFEQVRAEVTAFLSNFEGPPPAPPAEPAPAPRS
jgi:chromosome segregation ATPase